jgi:ABC-type phosphate transport system substrate-binding protein
MSRRAALRLGLALGAAAFFAAPPPRPARAGGPFVLVRNVKNSTSSLSRAELKDMAIGKRKVWSSGAAVQVVLGPPGSPELAWIASLLGVSDSTLMAKIRQEVFKGEMKRPITAANDQECAAAVSTDQGAFGVVSADTAKAMSASLGALSVQ